MTTSTTDAQEVARRAPRLSYKARALIEAFGNASFISGESSYRGVSPTSTFDASVLADRALSAYIAGLEARNGELVRQREEAWAAWQAECDRHGETCAELAALAALPAPAHKLP